MTRQFLRLFILLIASLILLAWSLDKAWHSLENNETRVVSVGSLFDMARDNPADMTPTPMSISDLAWPQQMLNDLKAGETIQLQGVQNKIFYYQLIDEQVFVLGPLDIVHEDDNYSLVISLFYLGFAIVIVVWLWPIFRDLQKLRVAAVTFSEQATWSPVQLSRTSLAYPMADTLNQMAKELESIIGLQREVSRTVGHEIRTPLARIQFSLESLKQDPNVEEIECIEEDIREIELLTEEFLQLARLQHHKGDLAFVMQPSSDCMNPLIERLQRNSKITIRLDSLGVTDFRIEESSFNRLLQNLITNALKFARSQVVITLTECEGLYELIVEDDGVGFDPNMELKQPFQQAQSGNLGYGLGLAIVDVIANWYDGNIVLGKSEVLGGARVSFVWPKQEVVS